MKKLIITTVIMLAIRASYGQWITKTVDNGIDTPYKIAYCENSTRNALLKLEQTEEGVALYLSGGYHCDDYPTIDLAVMINDQPQRYNFNCTKSKDGRTVFIVMNLLDTEQASFLADFKKGSSLVMRINESHCESDYYKFNMMNSTKAVEFMALELK